MLYLSAELPACSFLPVWSRGSYCRRVQLFICSWLLLEVVVNEDGSSSWRFKFLMRIGVSDDNSLCVYNLVVSGRSARWMTTSVSRSRLGYHFWSVLRTAIVESWSSLVACNCLIKQKLALAATSVGVWSLSVYFYTRWLLVSRIVESWGTDNIWVDRSRWGRSNGARIDGLWPEIAR